MSWENVVVQPVQEIVTRVGAFLPRLIGILIILVVGWIIAKFLQAALIKLLKILKMDVAAEKSGIATVLAKGDIKYTLSEAIGILVYWLIMLMVFMAVINALGLTVAANLLTRVIEYMPNVIASIFILVLGVFIAGLLDSVVRTTAGNAGIKQAKFLGQVVKVIILVFTLSMTLEQLRIGVNTINWIIKAMVGAIALAAGLSFGLGCKEIAGKFVAESIEKFKSQ